MLSAHINEAEVLTGAQRKCAAFQYCGAIFNGGFILCLRKPIYDGLLALGITTHQIIALLSIYAADQYQTHRFLG